jgi:hypothetical protein
MLNSLDVLKLGEITSMELKLSLKISKIRDRRSKLDYCRST